MNDTDTASHSSARGRCHPEEGRDPDIWYPIGTGPAYQRAVAHAKSECRQCPANTRCLKDALQVMPDQGVWAGFTAEELVEFARKHDYATDVSRPAYRQSSYPDGRDDLTIEHLVAGRQMPGAAEIDRAHAVAILFRRGDVTKEDLAKRMGTHHGMVSDWIKRSEAGEPLIQRKYPERVSV